MIWRKSSHSSDTADCVEVADGPRVGARDSKDPAGPALSFPAGSWRAFIAAVRDGDHLTTKEES